MKKRVEIARVIELQKELAEINKLAFEDILWYNNGLRVKVYPAILEDYKFMGLNNTDFVQFIGEEIEDVHTSK